MTKPSHAHPSDDARPEGQPLVVVIPGILGSVLAADRGPTQEPGDDVWGARFSTIGRTVLDPTRLSLDANPTPAPVGLMPNIALAGCVLVPGYNALVRALVNLVGPNTACVVAPGRPAEPSARVLLAPYDFRLGVEAAAEYVRDGVEPYLAGLSDDARDRRLIVVGHSMGGLVARAWLGLLSARGRPAWRDCLKLVTVGTPHRGAPKALDVLLNGRYGRVRLPDRFLEIVRNWRSAYDLLPRFPGIADGAAHRYPHELTAEQLGALGAPSSFGHRAGDAYKLHLAIEEAWSDLPGRGPGQAFVRAVGHRTLGRAELGAGGLAVEKRDIEWFGRPNMLGDKTVPAVSAVPVEKDGDAELFHPAPQTHLRLAGCDVLTDLLRNYLAPRAADIRGGPERAEPSLGVDLDPVHRARDPIPISFTLRDADRPAQAAYATVQPSRGRRCLGPVEATPAGDGWTVQSIPCRPGCTPSGLRPWALAPTASCARTTSPSWKRRRWRRDLVCVGPSRRSGRAVA